MFFRKFVIIIIAVLFASAAISAQQITSGDTVADTDNPESKQTNARNVITGLSNIGAAFLWAPARVDNTDLFGAAGEEKKNDIGLGINYLAVKKKDGMGKSGLAVFFNFDFLYLFTGRADPGSSLLAFVNNTIFHFRAGGGWMFHFKNPFMFYIGAGLLFNSDLLLGGALLANVNLFFSDHIALGLGVTGDLGISILPLLLQKKGVNLLNFAVVPALYFTIGH